jgi:pantoate--beta-alanine ligase
MILLADSVEDARTALRAARASSKSIGLVPTMGTLHAGHARLIECARAETGFVVVSIFVNPMQFGPQEDFARYPRNLDGDRALCERLGADLIFAPSALTMYPRDRETTTFVEVPVLSQTLEGASRPGHFRGVTTVVLKLFAIVQPDLAFFGAKDYQQQLIIRQMVADLNLAVEIRTAETVREPDGLALSSRNAYLDPSQRRAATVLFHALTRARRAVADGERDANQVRRVLTEAIESQRVATIDYAEVVDAETLRPLIELSPGQRAVGLVAVRFGSTRLIDNAILTE